MKLYFTTTKIKYGNGKTVTSAADHHVDFADVDLYAEGTVLAVRDCRTSTIYTTDFTYSGVAAVLAAATNTGGFFVLT
jgi:hypothetical protein